MRPRWQSDSRLSCQELRHTLAGRDVTPAASSIVVVSEGDVGSGDGKEGGGGGSLIAAKQSQGDHRLEL